MPYVFEFRGRAGFGTGFTFEGEIPGAESALDDLSYSFSGLNFSGRARGGDTELSAETENLSIQSPLVGRHNAANILAAAALGWAASATMA